MIRKLASRFVAVGVLVCLMPGAVVSEEIEVKAVEGLRFEPVRFSAKPGAELRVRVENADVTDLPHNFVLGKPGSLKKLVADALAMGGDGPARGFVPDVPEVLFATGLLAGGQSETLAVKVPEEPGIYPYLCTFPGHGYVMYGALYVGVEVPEAGDDPNIPPTMKAMVSGMEPRPFVQRIFMPKAGPAAIAVALPGGQNYCWDAGACRLRYAWKGEFIDAEKHFGGTGSALAKVLGKVYWRDASDGVPIRFFGKEAGEKQAVNFLGYRLLAGRPRLEYEIGGVPVVEFIEELPDGKGLLRHFEIPDAPGMLAFRLESERGLQRCDSGKPGEEGWIALSKEEARSFSVILTVH